MSDERALFRQVAGPAFDAMPDAVQRLHDVETLTCLSGMCRVERGRNPLARLLAVFLALPPQVERAPITVTIRREGNREVWIRSIAGKRFRSNMRRIGPGVLSETIGPVRFVFRLNVGANGFTLDLTRCRVLGIPLPRFLLPAIEARETSDGSNVVFDISARMPLIGLVVAYRGQLSVAAVPAGERPGEPVMLFDGICNFCNGGVDFFLRHDPFGRIRFAAMQSPRGLIFLRKHDLPEDDYKTFIVLDGDRIIRKSAAVFHLTTYLRWPWPMLKVFALVPRFIRDTIYDLFAQNRYKLMGKREVCRMPTEAERERFLL